MAGESIKPLLFLPPGTTPTAAAILIVQTLECKILACKCELSKDILQYALKILLCEDDSSLYPNNKGQSINSVLKTQNCANAAMQTDNFNQHHASVQTERCRIKLQSSGYKYAFNGNGENYDATTQVTFNDFSDKINVDDCEEADFSIDSPTEIFKNKQTFSACDNQIIPHTAKRQKKCKLDKHMSLSMDFHGRRLIDETKSRPPFTIPLIRTSDAEVCDPRTFDSNSSNKSEGPSHFRWRAQAICNCAALKRKKSFDQKENNVTLIDEELCLNLLNNTDANGRSSLVTPLNSVSPNRLNAKDETRYNNISKPYSQRTFQNKNFAKARRATIAEGMMKDLYLLSKDSKHKDTHLVDCFCNLAPREACASDPRIKLICADVSTDVGTCMKRNSGCSGNNEFVAPKKTRCENKNNVEHNSVTSSTTEQFGCLTPNESPAESPETPVSLASLSPEQICENNFLQKQQISSNKSYLSKNSTNVVSQTLIPGHKKVLASKKINSANNDTVSFKFKENNTNKTSTASHSHMNSNAQCTQVKDDLPIQQFSKDSKILRDPRISVNPSLVSPGSKKNGNITTNTENIPKLPTKLGHIREEMSVSSNQKTPYEQISNINKSIISAKSSKISCSSQRNINLEHKKSSSSTCLNNTTLNKECLQTKDNYEHLKEDKTTGSYNTSITELNRVSIDQQNKSKVKIKESDKILGRPVEIALQKTPNSDLSEESQSMSTVQQKIDIDPISDLLDIPSYNIISENKLVYDDNQINEQTKQSEEIYSPTDELSIGSNCVTLPTGCTAPSSPDKSPELELDKNEMIDKSKDKKNGTNPYQKIIAAVPSYMPTRGPLLPSVDKPCIQNLDNCDKMANSIPKTGPDNTVSKANDKIEYSIPEYITGEPDSAVPISMHAAGRAVENEMTQTEPEMKEWSPWLQPQSPQNYYKWCGQGNEFAPAHYQTYYPPYTNNYPTVPSNWMCYQWWNGNSNGWNHLW